MSVARSSASSSPSTAVVAALCALAVPGLGHIITGHKARGIIFLTLIAVTFWSGVAIGGVRNTITLGSGSVGDVAWAMAQGCTGVHAVAAVLAARRVPDINPFDPSPYVAQAAAADAGAVYTAMAGLLNLLVILDVLTRGPAHRGATVQADRRGPPPGSRS